MRLLSEMSAWVCETTGLKRGELGDVYAAISLVGSLLALLLALVTFFLK